MAGETLITVVGNLTADPELRFTPSGSAVANGTIAATPRTFDKNTNEWKDGETLFLRYAAWRELGENVAQSLVKGQRVIAQGFLKPNNYETKEGEKRNVIELEVQEMGPSLKYATAAVTRTQNSGQGGQGGFGGGQQGGYTNGAPQQPQQGAQGQWGGQPQAAAAQDPWATPGVPVQQAQPQYGQQPQQGYQQPQQGYAPQQGGFAPQQGEPPF